MTPDTLRPLSGDPSDTSSLIRALAVASDWQACSEALRLALPRVLPSIRLDIYAIESDDIAVLRFSSGDASIVPPPLFANADTQVSSWLERQGYSAITTLRLIGAGQQCGWLALSRQRGALSPAALALAEMLAPLIALRLHCDQIDATLANCRSQVVALQQRLGVTDTLRIRAMLAVGTAHDIGNLFTTMIGHAQMLEQDVPALLQSDVRVILRAAEDGRQLLRRLQDVKTEPEYVTTTHATPQTIIQDTIKLTRPFWERRSSITIETALQQIPAVRMPPTALREVLVNLIMNSVAAMPAGGIITIRCALIGDRAIISVTDTGQGIEREHHNTIFQPLITTHAEGSGLGLSVSRALVENCDGTLTVESAPGQGATFTITLPLAR